MLKKARVDDAGDTRFLPGQLVDRARILRENRRVDEEKSGRRLSGSRSSSASPRRRWRPSFLSAASFQETTKVLTDAAIEARSTASTGSRRT
jgi:DNA-directed RNA polymerase subunit beta'